jgi:hypothetical protein
MMWNLHLSCDVPPTDQYCFLFFKMTTIGEQNYEEIAIHFQSDIRSSDQSPFIFFEMSRIGEQNYEEIIIHFSCDIQSSDYNLAFPYSKWPDRWTEPHLKIFISHGMFDHMINLGFFSSKCAEYVHRTVFRNLHLLCDVRSSRQSHFLFFEMTRIREANYAEKSSFATWYSIIWWISRSLLRNWQNSWRET